MSTHNLGEKIEEEVQLTPHLTILHFNDVYDIQTKKGNGGICNFKATLDDMRN